jgi:hypothetical protein
VADLHAGSWIGVEVETPRRRARRARIRTNHDKLLATAEVLHRGGPAPTGTPPDRLKQQYWLAAHAGQQSPSSEPVDERM